MSASFTCDGCGSSVDVPTVVGHILKRDYCETCAPKAKAFQAGEEEARLDLFKNFQLERDTLIHKYSADGFKLPDVPNAS